MINSALMRQLRFSFAKNGSAVIKPSASTGPTTNKLTTTDKLNLLDQVITQLDTLNTTAQTPAITKESPANLTPDISPVEAGAGLQSVEYEKVPELPLEVESYLQEVKDNQDQTPEEIIIADGTTHISPANQPMKKPVIVLPITPKQEKAGKKKPPHWSIRWLVEWSNKIIKMFAGEVIYRQEPTTSLHNV
jgi:hypothetical protein